MRDPAGALRVLLVTPVLEGTGETLTAMRVAEEILELGGAIAFLATPLAQRLISPQIGAPCWPLTDVAPDNRASWDRALAEFKPNVLLFADYPLMFFPNGAAPLAKEPGWVASLEHVDALLVTFDHFGFAQGERSMFLGPSHLGFFAHYQLPALPASMHVLLPCPMHDPGDIAGRMGTPFRFWEFPLTISPSRREEIRREYLGDRGGKLVMHSVPRWAMQGARHLELPLYDHMPELLERYLGQLGTPVTLVSVNDGSLIRETTRSALRVRNLDTMAAADFESLLLSADLFLTENGLSISMGKALCAGVPCGALVNGSSALELMRGSDAWVSDLVTRMEGERSGAVYPWEVFPSVVPKDVDEIGLFRANRIVDAFARIELFGGDKTTVQLATLLDETANGEMRRMQRVYSDAVSSLTTAARAIYRIANSLPRVADE